MKSYIKIGYFIAFCFVSIIAWARPDQFCVTNDTDDVTLSVGVSLICYNFNVSPHRQVCKKIFWPCNDPAEDVSITGVDGRYVCSEGFKDFTSSLSVAVSGSNRNYNCSWSSSKE